MTNLLKTGSDWLEGMRKEHATSSVVYWRGVNSVTVVATIGQTIFAITDEYNVEVRTVMRDYLIQTADLIIDGSVVTPARGDRIKETVGESVYVYEVMGPGNNEPEWRYSDDFNKTLRIHTKKVDTE